jgi:hypothetical protein
VIVRAFAIAAILAASLLAETPRVLWAGSSSVYYHDLPNQVAKHLGRDYSAEIAGRSGDSIQVYLKPGSFKPQYGLAEGQTFLDKIAAGKYRFVVLQVVTHFLMGPGGAELEEALDVYAKAIRQAGGEPVFYEMGWGLDPVNDEGRARVMAAARRNGVKFYAPCSTAWKRVRAERPDLELHNLPDRTHPGTIGHYLNLAIFTSVLGGKPPEMLGDSYSWWPNLDEEGKKLSEERLATAAIDPYVRSLPKFLQLRSVMAKQHKLDTATAAYLRRVAWESVQEANRRLKSE